MPAVQEQEVAIVYPEHLFRDTPVGIKDVVHFCLDAYSKDQTQGERTFDSESYAFETVRGLSLGERAFDGTFNEPIQRVALDLYRQQYPDEAEGVVSDEAFNGITCGIFAFIAGEEVPSPDPEWRGL